MKELIYSLIVDLFMNRVVRWCFCVRSTSLWHLLWSVRLMWKLSLTFLLFYLLLCTLYYKCTNKDYNNYKWLIYSEKNCSCGSRSVFMLDGICAIVVILSWCQLTNLALFFARMYTIWEGYYEYRDIFALVTLTFYFKSNCINFFNMTDWHNLPLTVAQLTPWLG